MNYPAEFVSGVKLRAGDQCECERVECHPSHDRCTAKLVGDPDPRVWMPIHTGDRITLPPKPTDYIALCAHCAVPRTAPR